MTIKTEGEEETKLYAAVRMNDLGLVRQTIREGTSVNAKSGSYGWTALHEASSCGYLEIAISLLENGANPNIQDAIQKCTPIHLAAMNGHLEVVRSLIRKGARLDLRNAEGKTPEDSAEEDCRKFLQRQRAEEVIRLTPSAVEDDQSVRKLYGRRSHGSPVQKKVRQSNSPVYSESSQGSRESMASSSSSDSGDSISGLIAAAHQPGPGEISVSFEFNRRYQSLKILIWELRDLKLPVDHNITHIYVKAYLLPDRHKVTKRKTSLLKLDSYKTEGRKSSDSTTSWESEDSEYGQKTEKGMAQRMASVLKKRPHLSSKKRREREVKHTKPANPVESSLPYCRVSAFIDEALSYDTLALSKVNLDTCKVMLVLCGRNRVTLRTQPLAYFSVPLAGVIKMVTPEWYPLTYQIEVPRTPGTSERPLRSSKSWELEDGEFTGRSLAWNEPTMSMSMPNIEAAVTSQTTQGSMNASFTEGQKKYRKHSGAAKLFKNEFKLLRGRSKKSSTRKDCENTESFSTIARAGSEMGLANRAVNGLTQTLREQNRDIAEKLREFPRGRLYSNGESTTNGSEHRSNERIVEDLEVEPSSSEVELGPRSSFSRSLKYSRAFQQKWSREHAKEAVLSDVDVEDVEEITENPCAINNIYGHRRSGMACQ